LTNWLAFALLNHPKEFFARQLKLKKLLTIMRAVFLSEIRLLSPTQRDDLKNL